MASTLARVTDFAPSTPILSGEVDSEFNQLVNLLNGTSSAVKAVIKVSDSGDPPLELNQLSTGPILKGFQAGVENFRVRNNGGVRTPGVYDTNDNEQLLFSLTASAINEFTIKNAAAGNPVQLQATGGDTNIGITLVPKGSGVVKIQSGAPAANEDAANKAYVDGRKVSFSASFSIVDPSTANVNSREFGSVVIPAGGAHTITRCAVVYRAGSHTAGGSLVFNVELVGTGTISAEGLNNTNNAVDTVYYDDIADLGVSEGAVLSVYLASRSGTITEQNVSVIIEGYRLTF